LRRPCGPKPALVVADASPLQKFDSSALAVLLECRREALLQRKSFAVKALPTRCATWPTCTAWPACCQSRPEALPRTPARASRTP
jgi:predicted metal-binding protein